MGDAPGHVAGLAGDAIEVGDVVGREGRIGDRLQAVELVGDLSRFARRPDPYDQKLGANEANLPKDGR